VQEYYLEVGTRNYKENLFRRLSDLRSKEGLPIDLYEMKNDAHYLVRCVFSDNDRKNGIGEQERLTVRIYQYYFARALAEIIFQGWEGIFIKKVLKKEYCLNSRDVENISEMARSFLNNEEKGYLPATRKHVLVKSILEYLNLHKRFDIEGFLNFRAGHYKKELKKQIARAVNEYSLEQEHESFIRLLKRFLQTQNSVYKTMHLVLKKQNKAEFYDDCGRNINCGSFESKYPSLAVTAGDKDLSEGKNSSAELYEDFLISTLLQCAPRTLIIHQNCREYDGFLQIIGEVFENRVRFCNGCILCQESD